MLFLLNHETFLFVLMLVVVRKQRSFGIAFKLMLNMTRFSMGEFLNVVLQVGIELSFALLTKFCVLQFFDFIVKIFSFDEVLVLESQDYLFPFVKIFDVMGDPYLPVHSRLIREREIIIPSSRNP